MMTMLPQLVAWILWKTEMRIATEMDTRIAANVLLTHLNRCVVLATDFLLTHLDHRVVLAMEMETRITTDVLSTHLGRHVALATPRLLRPSQPTILGMNY